MVLERALNFIESQLNTYLTIKSGEQENKIELTGLVKPNGDLLVSEKKIGLSLVNIEEERIGKTQDPYFKASGGSPVQANPDIKLNLYLLFTANFKKYDEALKALSQVISFFQSRNVFERSKYPSMDPAIEKLVFELQTLTFEQMNHLWGALGAKYMPSVLYKMRMLVISEEEIQQELMSITEFNINARER